MAPLQESGSAIALTFDDNYYHQLAKGDYAARRIVLRISKRLAFDVIRRILRNYSFHFTNDVTFVRHLIQTSVSRRFQAPAFIAIRRTERTKFAFVFARSMRRWSQPEKSCQHSQTWPGSAVFCRKDAPDVAWFWRPPSEKPVMVPNWISGIRRGEYSSSRRLLHHRTGKPGVGPIRGLADGKDWGTKTHPQLSAKVLLWYLPDIARSHSVCG